MDGVPSLLVDALEQLQEKEVKRFKWTLTHDIPEGFRCIPRGQLEKRDIMDMVDLMVDNYEEEGAVRIMLHVLQKINQNNVAKWLEQERENAMTCTPKGRHESCSSADLVKGVQGKLKSRLRKKYEFVYEGIAKRGQQVTLNEIYTELYITEGESGGINNEHEVRQIETASKMHTTQEMLVGYNEIFKSAPDQNKPIKTVMTKGIAGIGKTVSVQKFVLDWASEKANEDIDLMFMLPFRELNLLRDKKYSLQGLVRYFHPEMQDLERVEAGGHTVLFIFDGLDESHLALDFEHNQKWYDVKEETMTDVLLTNLIMGNLFCSALLWITTRPAAANQIPHDCIQRVTEVRGFNDLQKEEYFRKRFTNQITADSIIKHIKSTRSLYIMCHIPIFCWISATVLERLLGRVDRGNLPKTLTQLYTNFLLILLTKAGCRHSKGNERDGPLLSDREIILKLGELAFRHLEKGNLIFYDKDLRECRISASEASIYRGLITEIHDEDSEVNGVRVYRFIHLSIQEYLAALFVFLSFKDGNKNLLDQSAKGKFTRLIKRTSLSDIHKLAVNKAVQSKNGELDLFLRFLLGVSMDSNQTLLQGLMSQPLSSESKSAEESARYIKSLIRKKLSPERVINLFHCLSELNDSSLVQEIHSFLSQGNFPSSHLSAAQCSALAYVLMMSEKEIDVLDLKKYQTSHEGLMRLLPVAKYSRRVLLDGCNLSQQSCDMLASALDSGPSNLRELDLSNNDLADIRVHLLCAGLEGPHCKLQTLRLDGCNLSHQCCELLASALNAKQSNLRELDLRNNALGDTGVHVLCAGLGSPHCRLETLRLGGCGLTCDCCQKLSSVVLSGTSKLIELDVSNNDLQDAGVTLFCASLGDPQCTLEKLSLSLCGVRDDGCVQLSSALHSNPSHLRELDLSFNYPGEPALDLLSKIQTDPSFRLQTLLVDYNGVSRNKQRLLKYACALTLDPNTIHPRLVLSEGGRKITRVKELQPYPDHPRRLDTQCQALCKESLSGRCYWEAEWSRACGRLGVMYEGIDGKGDTINSDIGFNEKSWCLQFYYEFYSAWHNKMRSFETSCSHLTNRVGVYLDWPAGTLSFYSVSAETVSLLQSFRTTFTEPLYPVFYAYFDTSMTLCMLE